jgi:hypothetical protein
MNVTWQHTLIGIGLIGLGLALSGCDRGEPVTFQDAPKAPPRTAVPPGHPPMGSGAMQAPAQIRWEVPAGWKQMPGGEMRFATFVLEDDPVIELTVIPLGMQAGSLVANVNRWEAQINQPPTPEAELGKVVTRIEANGLRIDEVDLTGTAQDGTPQRVLGAILPHDGRVWFFKAVGPPQKMAQQKENFGKFIRSIRFEMPAAPAPAGPDAPAAPAPATPPAG